MTITCDNKTGSVSTRADEKLKFHSALFNNICDAIVVTDQDFRVTHFNKAASEIFEWKEEEAIGKCVKELGYATYPNSSPNEVRDILYKNGSWKGEFITSRKGGQIFPAFLSISTIKGETGNAEGTVAVIRDITEEKKREEKITYLADLVNKANDAIISVDCNYNIVSWNKGSENIFGNKYEEVAGKSIFNFWARTNSYWLREEVLKRLDKYGYWQGEI